MGLRLYPCAASANECQQVIEARTGRIGQGAKFLRRKTEAVDPKCWISERDRSGGIPAGERDEQDLLLRQSKRVDAELVRFGIWLVGACCIRAQHLLEHVVQAR